MFEPHDGTLQLKHEFQNAYNWLEKHGLSGLMTKRGTDFVAAQAEITQKGPHTGEKVIRFMQNIKVSARAYEYCWGRYYNCDRTRNGMYCSALDDVIL